ncbi:hypothetical protein KI387_012733, partial [Taxus chinensis]
HPHEYPIPNECVLIRNIYRNYIDISKYNGEDPDEAIYWQKKMQHHILLNPTRSDEEKLQLLDKILKASYVSGIICGAKKWKDSLVLGMGLL